MTPGYGYMAAMLIGAAGAWYVQGIRWDNDIAQYDRAIAANVDAVNTQLIASRAQTEQIRRDYETYKQGKENETTALERAVADGTKRLRVAARCPEAVRTDGTVPGRAGAGAPELTAAARSDYFELRRGLDRQYGLLQLCRSELRKRSAGPGKL